LTHLGTNVLALSGGGYRGLYTLRVLNRLEESTGRSITEDVDLLTGTSIGGIIALALAAGHRPADLERLFIERGADIFQGPTQPWRRTLRRVGRTLLFRPMYSNDALADVLNDLFGDLRMGQLEYPVTIPTANISTGKPQFFKSMHSDKLDRDEKVKVRDVALATSAAPAYFPIHSIDGSKHVDGALVGNAPGLFGWLEAGRFLERPSPGIHVLSIGTLSGKPIIDAGDTHHPGALYWLGLTSRRLLQQMMTQQEHLSDYMLQLILQDRYHLIDGTVTGPAHSDIELDDPSPAAQRALLSAADSSASEFLATPFYPRFFNIDHQECVRHAS
jgi:cGAMP-activated phospholipase